MAMNSCGCGHRRADQMGATTRTLASLKIAIAGGGATLTWLQAISIHGQAHGAAWFAPFETSRLENLMQAFAFGLFLDLTRAWYNQGQLDSFGDFLPQFFDQCSGVTQVFNPAVGAGTDEDFVNIQ